MPKVSIIVPVYNTERYLPKCLNSILNQTLQDIEVICVNDGSTDQSLAILQDFARKDKRIKVISQENHGLGATRNVGLKMATGEYIGFVDSDDYISPEMYERLWEKAERYQSDIIICNVFLYDTISGATSVFRDESFYQAMDETEFFTSIEHPRVYEFIGVWDRIYKHSFLAKNELENPENRIYEDVLFTVKSLSFANKISIVNRPLYYYRKNTGVSIVDKEVVTDSYKFDFLKNLKESKEFLLNRNIYTAIRKQFLAFQFVGILFHQKNMQTRKSFLQFMKELRDILDDLDIDNIRLTTTWYPASVYLWLLQKRKYNLTYILVKIGKLFKSDSFFFYFRLPKGKHYFRIKKPGYKWKCELQIKRELVWEIREIRKGLEQRYGGT